MGQVNIGWWYKCPPDLVIGKGQHWLLKTSYQTLSLGTGLFGLVESCGTAASPGSAKEADWVPVLGTGKNLLHTVCWFVCLQVKAVKIYLAGGLNTEDYLLVWDSFVADHGQPLVAHGDKGTNLTSAAGIR